MVSQMVKLTFTDVVADKSGRRFQRFAKKMVPNFEKIPNKAIKLIIMMAYRKLLNDSQILRLIYPTMPEMNFS